MVIEAVKPEEVGVWDVYKIDYYIKSNQERGNLQRVKQLQTLKSKII